MKRSFILFLTIIFSLLSCEREPDFEKIEYVKYNHQLFENVKLGVLIKQVFKDLKLLPKNC